MNRKWTLWGLVVVGAALLSTISNGPAWNYFCGFLGGALAISVLEHA